MGGWGGEDGDGRDRWMGMRGGGKEGIGEGGEKRRNSKR